MGRRPGHFVVPRTISAFARRLWRSTLRRPLLSSLFRDCGNSLFAPVLLRRLRSLFWFCLQLRLVQE